MKYLMEKISKNKDMDFNIEINNYISPNNNYFDLQFTRMNEESNSVFLTVLVGEDYQVFRMEIDNPFEITEEELNRIIKHADLVYESYGHHGPGKYGIEIHVDDEAMNNEEVIIIKYLSDVKKDMNLSSDQDAIKYMSTFFKISENEFIENLKKVGEDYNNEIMYTFKINKEKNKQYDEEAREEFRKSNKMRI